jgi:membrane glycosyltransferase
MSDLNVTRTSMGIHTVLGIIAGYVSIWLENVLFAAGAAIVILIITGYVTEMIVKKKGIKWWLTNGGVLYLLVWIVSWVYLFNL